MAGRLFEADVGLRVLRSRKGRRVRRAARLTLEKSLPSEYYLSPEIFAKERERIFSREWVCAGRSDGLPEAGTVKVLELLGESLLVARTSRGRLKAHYNVCRHRGARLCAGDAAGPTIRCPYHAWTYDLDGKLLGAPFLNQDPALREEDFSLHPVGIAEWGGFFFLNLWPAGPVGRDFERWLGPVAARLARYPLASLVTSHRLEYDVRANWKVVAENYNECYHCAGVHPELCEVVPAFREQGGAGLDWDRGVPHRDGAFTFTRSGTTPRAPFAGLSEEERTRHKGELVYPNLFLSLSADHVAAFRLLPEAPDRTRVVCEFLFDPAEAARPGFDPSDAVEFWDLINRQDWAICEEVQRGTSSRVHRFGYYAPMEDSSLDIRRYVLERLGEAPTS
ncbi:MAG TPA: aromatic ring-hydroxylating dioxygenase subunit alpha [Thermoanaerobaculia bacterium]|nr:aromatic ring-hydroxylating dioxygenase subunit alpha [Thermoanaerobaculia bacterium]